MHTTITYYSHLYKALGKLAKHNIQLIDILKIDESEPEFLRIIHPEEREILLNAINRNQDNVSAIYLKVKSAQRIRNHKGSSAWYRLGASILIDDKLTKKLANAEELDDCVDLLQGLIFMHPELISFDGEYYSPEGCVNLKGIEGEYKFYDYEH
jgi:hypothetical protein